MYHISKKISLSLKKTFLILFFIFIGNSLTIAQINYVYDGETYFDNDELITRKDYKLKGDIKFLQKKVGSNQVNALFNKNGLLEYQSFQNQKYNFNDSIKIEYLYSNDSTIFKYILYAISRNIVKKIKEVFLENNRPSKVFNYLDNDNIFSNFNEPSILYDSIIYHYDTLKNEIIQNIFYLKPKIRQDRLVFDEDYKELEHTSSIKEEEYSLKLIFREISNIDSLYNEYQNNYTNLEVNNSETFNDFVIETTHERNYGQSTTSIKYIFLNKNQLSKILTVDNNYYTETLFDSYGKIILTEKYDYNNKQKGKLQFSEHINYNAKHQNISDIKITLKDTIFTNYIYSNNQINVIEKANDYCIEMILDSNNNLHSEHFERTKYIGKNTCCGKYENIYHFDNTWKKTELQDFYIQFDKLGNWTEVKCYRNGLLENINSQIIEYYR